MEIKEIKIICDGCNENATLVYCDDCLEKIKEKEYKRGKKDGREEAEEEFEENKN